MSTSEGMTTTAEELEAMQRELHQLEGDGRNAIAARIKTAREWGDLKENAEYHAAKEDQAHLETAILKLRGRIRDAVLVENSGSTDLVEHGSTVTYTDGGSGRRQTFRLVAPHDAKPAEGTMSVASPVARALMGRRLGDEVEVQTPSGVRTLHIEEIS
jgi:transcription elongation factor GreA